MGRDIPVNYNGVNRFVISTHAPLWGATSGVIIKVRVH